MKGVAVATNRKKTRKRNKRKQIVSGVIARKRKNVTTNKENMMIRMIEIVGLRRIEIVQEKNKKIEINIGINKVNEIGSIEKKIKTKIEKEKDKKIEIVEKNERKIELH